MQIWGLYADSGGGVHEITGAESALGVRCEHQVLACPAASQNSVRDEVSASALHLRRNPPSPPFGTMSGRDLRAMIARPALQPREVFDALLSPPARALASCREGSRPRLFDPAGQEGAAPLRTRPTRSGDQPVA